MKMQFFRKFLLKTLLLALFLQLEIFSLKIKNDSSETALAELAKKRRSIFL